MEKQLSLIGYWLGLICTVLALILRMLTALKMLPSPGPYTSRTDRTVRLVPAGF
jgi:hypothetical protein